MDEKARKLKNMIKGKVEEKPSFGTNPWDPWSTKSEISEDAMLNRFLKSRGINPQFVSKDQKVAHAKTGEFQKWLTDHQFEEYVAEDAMLDRFLRSRGINPLFATKDQKVSYSKTGEFQKWLRDHQFEEYMPEDRKQTPVKGGVEQKSKALAAAVSKHAEVKTPAGSLHDIQKEDVYQDSYAATQTPFDMGTTPNQTVDSRKKQIAKAARMIKDIYRKKNMREDMFDSEKEDKSVATYGKKPKHEKTDPNDSLGENKPNAAAVLSGGTTLTGSKRDTVEIDPIMRRSNQPDPTKKTDNKKTK